VFPLLRQSAEATKRGPILWWGRLVDFGSFSEAINRHSEEKEIGIDFKVSFDARDISGATTRTRERLSIIETLEPGVLDICVRIRNGKDGSYTSGISLSVFDFHANWSLDEQGLATEIKSGAFSWKPSNQLICYGVQDSLMPNPTFFKQTGKAGDKVWEGYDPFSEDLQSTIRRFVHGKTGNDRVYLLANRVPIGPRKKVFDKLLQIANPPTFRELLTEHGPDSSDFMRLYDLSFLSRLNFLLTQARRSLDSFLKNVLYVEPLRATAQRYYRQQSLDVGEIDSKGANIAMYLDSLSARELSDFQNWTAKHFGIMVASKKEGGHISLTIQHLHGEARTNIADMGFGFSQMLPIAAQLWAVGASRATEMLNRRKAGQSLVVIEQPELHLHPDYQAKLADVFVAAIGEQADNFSPLPSTRLQIIAETHSPFLINRLGALIADKVVEKEHIQVLLFEQDDLRSSSQVRVTEFDDDGILRNWPLGFFEPLSRS